MSAKKCLAVVLLFTGFGAVLGAALPATLVRADANKCCNPAHPATPTAPPGSGTDCTFNQTTMICQSAGACLYASAWQTAIPGACQNVAMMNCTPNAGQTNVTIKKGYWLCAGGAADCTCDWFESTGVGGGGAAGSDIKPLTDCAGSPCPAPPPPS